MTYQIRSLGFLPDGAVTIDYVDLDSDIRKGGLVANHVLLVPPSDIYEDAIYELRDAVIGLLTESLDDFEHSVPWLPSEEDEPARPSPYDNPAER